MSKRTVEELKEFLAELLLYIPSDTKCNDGKLLNNANNQAIACAINMPVAIIRRAKLLVEEP